MIFLKTVLEVIVGFFAGIVVSAALVALIVTIGVINRLAVVTKTAQYIQRYETIFMSGAIIANLYSLYMWQIPLGWLGLVIYGFFSGVFLGCFIGGIAEVLNATPIFYHRISLKTGLKVSVYAMALGKLIGTLMYYFKVV